MQLHHRNIVRSSSRALRRHGDGSLATPAEPLAHHPPRSFAFRRVAVDVDAARRADGAQHARHIDDMARRGPCPNDTRRRPEAQHLLQENDGIRVRRARRVAAVELELEEERASDAREFLLRKVVVEFVRAIRIGAERPDRRDALPLSEDGHES